MKVDAIAPKKKARKKTVITVKSLTEFKTAKTNGTLANLKMCTVTVEEKKVDNVEMKESETD